jgi:hypothetical protein
MLTSQDPIESKPLQVPQTMLLMWRMQSKAIMSSLIPRTRQAHPKHAIHPLLAMKDYLFVKMSSQRISQPVLVKDNIRIPEDTQHLEQDSF